MEKKILFLTVVLTFGFLLSNSTFNSIQSQDANCTISISSPDKDGTGVGLSKLIKGNADIPSGKYLWVLVHRIKGFKDVWYPQGECEIDPVTKDWEVTVHFGQPQDIGYEFEIVAIIVNESEHAKLRSYWLNAMQSGDWKPIIMPPFECTPVYRTVKKTSHY